MSPALLVLTRSESGFIRERSAAVTIPRVASTSRRWRVSTSEDSKSADLLGATG